MIRFNHKGGFKNVEKLFSKSVKTTPDQVLQYYGKLGVQALASATPAESGKTAAAWSYEIVHDSGGYSIFWNNDNINDGVNIAVILQYGHGTGTGGYVEGIDYINPAIRPIFEQLAEKAWREVLA